MSLTDLELCKKIAEIECVSVYMYDKVDPPVMVVADSSIMNTIYNPLINKALLWDLMVKHKVEIDYCDSHCSIFGIDENDWNAISTVEFCIDQLPRAILECIIESYTK